MGNTLLTTQKIACGHTDRTHLQRNLLCDRLSQPTAEMVDALLFLQDHTDELAQFGKTLLRSEPGMRSAAWAELIASCVCTLFEYSSRREGDEGQGVLAAFAGVLEQPQRFLQDLMSLRAQAIPKEKITQVQYLLQEVDFQASHDSDEVLDKVAVFVKAAMDCAKIYCEIRDFACVGQIDRHQAAKLLDGPESDQRRMINAMRTGRPDAPDGPGLHKEP
mmetsp:Transcript_40464/g.94615  ORF Transcript_40464/g.94615 Transcript_40464/m.94615 type:complete len:219 (-) Transcript_40464:109-765(-)|eukprot:s3090_g5.t1